MFFKLKYNMPSKYWYLNFEFVIVIKILNSKEKYVQFIKNLLETKNWSEYIILQDYKISNVYIM